MNETRLPSPHPARPAPTRRRRRALYLMLLVLLVLLAGCGGAPVKPEPPLHQRQAEALRALGFEETDDGWLMNIAEPISFELDQAELRPDLVPQLRDAAGKLLAVDLRVLRIEGHTDRSGTREYNEKLSLRRSRAVAAVFAAAGFRAENIDCRGLAWDYPIASQETREGRAENRRVTVIVPAESMASAP